MDTVNEPVSLTAYAKHRGCSTPMVSKAISRGRLTEAAVVYVNGQPKIRDIETADLEWDRNRSRPAPAREAAAPDLPDVDRLSVITMKQYVVLVDSDPKEAIDVEKVGWFFPLTAAGARIVAQ